MLNVFQRAKMSLTVVLFPDNQLETKIFTQLQSIYRIILLFLFLTRLNYHFANHNTLTYKED
jgi:hypothetical protein